MAKIAGLDLGTNSIGISVRDTDKGTSLQDQLDFFTSVIFKSGVGRGKSGEFSYAAERTQKRSPRRLYQARKYRIWATLRTLIKYGYCPLSEEDLDKWSRYDKSKGLKRQYPVDAVAFEQWVRLDFDGDGIADYSSPYQLRAELTANSFDFSKEMNRYKLGRALYHIAQRRGFRSSKGETLKEQESAEVTFDGEADVVTALKKSEEKKSKTLVGYMEEHKFITVGQAFAHLEKNGVRVRGSEYQAVRSQYKEEITHIFEFQKLDLDDEFCKSILSEKKSEGTIFYKRPLRSQKGLVGKCTLEPSKVRCPISHPELEKFRAWCLINNIKFGEGLKETLSLDQKQRLYNERFLLTRANFRFADIHKWIEKEVGKSLEYHKKTINYKDNTNVSGCPVTGRLKSLLGDDWEEWTFVSNKERIDKKTGEVHSVSYTALDLWHICFSFDEAENIEEFAKSSLNFDNKQIGDLVRIWGAIQQGYGMLSLKAIKNINRFLQKGLIYTDAVLLAKLPDMFGNKWGENESEIISDIAEIIEGNRKEKQLKNIANMLIADYKSLAEDERFAFKNTEYVLDNDDRNDVRKAVIEAIGKKTWNKIEQDEQEYLIVSVSDLYQEFFASVKRDYFRLPKLSEALGKYLRVKYSFLSEKDLNKIYHPSMIEIYAPAKYQRIEDGRSLKLLGSPVIGALKNPMAMRVLHILRGQINQLLKDGTIDEDTRMVVETARELNDANMRWAIEAYQREREKENDEYAKAIEELINDSELKASPKSEGNIDKLRLWLELANLDIVSKLDSKGKPLAKTEQGWKTYGYTTSKLMFDIIKCKQDAVKKYRLWKEQNFQCIYTGRMISLADLFTPNQIDFEHTIPRSISFDNSLANLTVCDAHYNRTVKKNLIPSQLPEYEKIKMRIQPWIDKVERLKDNVEFWKGQSKRAQDKDRKDYCIRQRHLWQMELDYWRNKVERFTMTEVKSGFRNSQLNDTRIITKYAYHYLKTVFTKVEVQNGRYTSDFRKMLGIQSVDEKKNRDKHSHHAIDATMLTLIPVAAQRDKMLTLFYQKEEEKKKMIHGDVNHRYAEITEKLQREINRCAFCKVPEVTNFIEDNILVNHISKDQTLTLANRRKRIRGKIVPLRDRNGKILFEKNEDSTFKLERNGHRIPMAKERMKGDCIRGQLHSETFYGAITQAATNENGIFMRNIDGSIKTDEIVRYVVRRDLLYKKDAQSPGFKTWDELEKVIVNKQLVQMMKSQFSDSGISFKNAVELGIWMLDKHGNKVNKIRRVRCYASTKNPLMIKKQTYLSSKDYKNHYYAEIGDLHVMCKYENKDMSIKEYKIWSLFDISNNRKMNMSDIPNEINEKKDRCVLFKSQQVKVGDMVLIYQDYPDEVKEMESTNISNRLYVVRGFENDGNRIILRKHTNAQEEKLLGKGESIKDYSKMPEKIRCGINTLNFLLQGHDFNISPNGKITFL